MTFVADGILRGRGSAWAIVVVLGRRVVSSAKMASKYGSKTESVKVQALLGMDIGQANEGIECRLLVNPTNYCEW